MAGTFTVEGIHTDGDSSLRLSYTFAYGDEWDAVDWAEYTPGVDGPTDLEEQAFDLDGDALLWVTGPGVWRGALYRAQGAARNEWRSTDSAFPDGVAAADGVQTFSTGGPVKTVGALRGSTAQRLS